MTSLAPHARPNQVIVARRMGHCGWPACPSQWVGPPDAHPTVDKKWKRTGDYVRQTKLNSSLTRFIARFEGRSLRTATVKGWTELGKETEEREGGSGRNRVFKRGKKFYKERTVEGKFWEQ